MTPCSRSKVVRDLSTLASGIEAHAPDPSFPFAGQTHDVRATFVRMFSHPPDVPADMALSPARRRPPPTHEERAKRVTKAAGTREKRVTPGQNQSAAIEGTATGVVVRPIVAGGKGTGG